MLKEQRERRGLSIETFSERTRISVARLKKLEAPGGDPRIKDVVHIARALRMPLLTLMRRVEQTASARAGRTVTDRGTNP